MADIKIGSASVSRDVLLRKAADSTELTGIAFGSVTAYYTRQGAAPVHITSMSALSGPTAAYSAGGWWEYDSTNQKGLYRIDLPDAMWVTGATFVTLTLQTSTGFTYAETFELKAQTASDVFTQIGTNGAGLTALGDVRLAHLDADVSSRGTSNFAGGAVASVTGSVGSVAGAVGSVAGNIGGIAGVTLPSVVPSAAQNASAVMADVSDTVGADVVAIKAKTDALSTTPAADAVTAMMGHLVETGVTLQQWYEIIGAVLAGNATSAGAFKALGNPSTPRASATLDGSGNRTVAVTP